MATKASTALKQLRLAARNSRRTYGPESAPSHISYKTMPKIRARGQAAKLGWALQPQMQ